MAEFGHGKYGATGGQLIGARFDAYAAEHMFKSTPDSARGFRARLRYLDNLKSGSAALADRGIGKGGRRQINAWLSGSVRPRASTKAAVDQAYREVRRANIARVMGERLRRGGRGTVISVQPLPASALPPSHQRRQAQLEDREVRVRPQMWDRMISAWLRGDAAALDDAWMDVCEDISSPPELYYEVAHVGFGI